MIRKHTLKLNYFSLTRQDLGNVEFDSDSYILSLLKPWDKYIYNVQDYTVEHLWLYISIDFNQAFISLETEKGIQFIEWQPTSQELLIIKDKIQS